MFAFIRIFTFETPLQDTYSVLIWFTPLNCYRRTQRSKKAVRKVWLCRLNLVSQSRGVVRKWMVSHFHFVKTWFFAIFLRKSKKIANTVFNWLQVIFRSIFRISNALQPTARHCNIVCSDGCKVGHKNFS